MEHKSDYYIGGTYKNGEKFYIEFKSTEEVQKWANDNYHLIQSAAGIGLVSMTVVSIIN